MSRRLRAHLALWVVTALGVGVAGQSSNVAECIPSYSWSLNSKGQTPCLVAAYLESACGTPTLVDAIPPNTHYLGPAVSQADPCKCNSVTYSMVSACGGCQNRNFANWTEWTEFCPSVLNSVFPQPVTDATEVPAWAFINLSQTGNTFDPNVAAANASGTPPPASTSKSSATLPPPSTTSSEPTSSTQSVSSSASTLSPSNAKSHSNAGAIAGGVVGGLLFLAVIVLLVLWYYLRRRRDSVQKDITFDSRAFVAGTPAMSQNVGSSSDGPSSYHFSQSEQDTPEIISTYPASPMGSTVYTHLPPATNVSVDSLTPSVAQLGGGLQPARPQQYQGFNGRSQLA